jgi:TfoX/Sxy family transcriptional regulator of competence genes
MKKWKKAPAELVETFNETFIGDDSVVMRKMFGYPCCFINEQMFTGLHQEDWVLRLSESNREKFLKLTDSRIFEPMRGRVMKEYVVVPKEVIGNSQDLKKWIAKSKKYVLNLPPKKTAFFKLSVNAKLFSKKKSRHAIGLLRYQ